MNNSIRHQQQLIWKIIRDNEKSQERTKSKTSFVDIDLTPTIEEVEKYGELITDYSVDEYEEVDAGHVNVYLYQDKTYSIVEWQPHASKKGKEFIMV